ncbi:hypothetical protein QYF36_015348 [Acer negundo]|nr:hypothetical protein QYF36_015348 [Acer negundo]
MGENYVVKWVFLIVIANFVVFTIGFSSDFPILTKNTYIIQMDKSAMPESFSSHLDWYSSKVKSILVEPEAESDDDQDRIIYSYQNAFHGIAARLSEEEAERLEEEDGVVAVFPDTKTVTNVGPPVSNYHVVVSQFKGCALTVEPTALNFTGKHQKLSYKITFKTKSRQTIPEFGGLIWKDAVHTVRSPIVVTWLPPL